MDENAAATMVDDDAVEFEEEFGSTSSFPVVASRVKLLEELQRDNSFPFYGFIKNEVGATSLVIFKDLARYFGVPSGVANKITQYGPAKDHLNDDQYTDWLQQTCQELGITFDDALQSVHDHMDICYVLRGVRFNSSIHASGVIMSKRDVNMPLDQDHVLPFNGENLEHLGYIKYDLLSVDILNTIQYFYGADVDWTDVNDPEVWTTIRNGDTDYVFQFPAKTMQNALRKTGPAMCNVERLAELTAINRPGPLGAGVLEKWLAMLNGQTEGLLNNEEECISLLLKREFGEDTHTGLLIYQEDVMKLFQVGSNFTLAEADTIRRAIGKKKKDLLDSYRGQFVDNWAYDHTITIDGLGTFLPEQEIELEDGGTITAEELLEKVNAGEKVNVKDPDTQ